MIKNTSNWIKGFCCAAAVICGVGTIEGMSGIGNIDVELNLSTQGKYLVYDLQTQPMGELRPRLIWSDTGEEATYDEYCKINPTDVPKTRQELDAWLFQYDSLIQQGKDPRFSDFFAKPIDKEFARIEFNIYSNQNPLPFSNLRRFFELLSNNENGQFQQAILSIFNCDYTILLMRLEDCIASGLSADRLFVSPVAAELRSLADSVRGLAASN
jgi:hypothetical protein